MFLTRVFIFLCITVLFGEDIVKGNTFRHLQSKDGLHDGEINGIVQDHDGLMWFATWSGLVKYDGYDFIQYRPELGNPYSLPEKKINLLYVDSANTLWVAGNRDLCFYDRALDRFKSIPFEGRDPHSTTIRNIVQLDSMLIVHEQQGFYYIPLYGHADSNFLAHRLNVSHSFGSLSISELSWWGKAAGQWLVIANHHTGGSTIYSASISLESHTPALRFAPKIQYNGLLHSLSFVDAEKNLYLATDKGIVVHDLNTGKAVNHTYFKQKEIQRIVYSAVNHSIYASGADPELLTIDLHTGEEASYQANPYEYGTLLNNKILSMFVDFSGNLWIGHQGQGISILNLKQKAFYTSRQNPFLENSLTSNKVMCFEGNTDYIFVGLRAGGINYFAKNQNRKSPQFGDVLYYANGQTGEFRHGVWDMARLSENEFLVGTDAGLMRLFRRLNEWVVEPFNADDPLFNKVIQKIYIDKNNTIWCGGLEPGLMLIPNPVENSEKVYYQYKSEFSNAETLSDDAILSMHVDSRGRFWIGTVNGLNLLKTNYQNLDLSGRAKPELRFKRFLAKHPNSGELNNNEINDIFENHDGTLWLATMGGGINILNTETDSFSYITMDEGLPVNDVLAIQSDKSGTLWISTTKGLVSYAQHNSEPAFIRYNVTDGIQGDVFLVNASYKSMDGELYFGGDNGFTRFYPSEIKANPIKPKILLTGFKFGNRTVHIGDSIQGRKFLEKHIHLADAIELPFNHKTFSIGVSPMHYQYPEGNKIAFKLEGYDKAWRTIPGYYNNIYYSNLPSGKYTLLVKGVSSDNQVSDQTKTLQITVRKPWYLTWYVVILFMLFAVALIGGIIYILVNRQRLVFDKQIDRITVENTESKMTFLTNIAHGLRTPLSLVVAPIEDLIRGYSDIKPEWKSHLYTIQRNANYLQKLINQIIDFRKLSAGKLQLYMQNTDIVAIIKEVVANFQSFEKSQMVNIQLDMPFDSLLVPIDGEKIEEVLYNIISNAFKHTPQNRNIYVSLKVIEAGESSSEDEKNQLRISIMNEGEVILDEDKEKIFERFYKKNEQIEGAGIGLSFSRSLVEMHHGRLEAEPVAGRGTQFHIYLPFTSDPLTEPASEKTGLAAELMEESGEAGEFFAVNNEADEKRLKIVLIEDNEELRNFLNGILSRQYACYVADNGEEGIELIQNIIPDIVISDVIMPGRDGYEVCREVKSNKNTCHIPVILLTAKNSQDEIISGYDVGADVYVTKPFSLNVISSQISRLIKNRELIRKKYQDQNFMIEIAPQKMSRDDEFIIQVRKILEAHLLNPEYNVKSLANSLNVSSTQLYRKLKALTGYSPVEFLRVLKLQKAYETLVKTDNSVKEVCYMSGFNNFSYFIKCFKDHFGVTPANLKEQGSIPTGNFHNTKQSKISNFNHSKKLFN
ncbi:MAG: hybrid sensor histidine kinase/response regulator transcription factor [Bacteroidota bacterium]